MAESEAKREKTSVTMEAPQETGAQTNSSELTASLCAQNSL